MNYPYSWRRCFIHQIDFPSYEECPLCESEKKTKILIKIRCSCPKCGYTFTVTHESEDKKRE